MRTFILFLVAFAISSYLTLSAQIQTSLTEDIVTRFRLHFNNNEPDSVFNMLSPTTQRILPASKLQTVFTQIKSQVGRLDSTRMLTSKDSIACFKASFSKMPLLLTISTNSNQKIGILRFTPYTESTNPLSNLTFNEVDINFIRPDLTLRGTLTLPRSGTQETLILIVPGSGPTDRNGNQLGATNNSLQLISRGLAEQGIASVRYDKRGVGESRLTVATEKTLRFDDYVSDLTSITQNLSQDKRFKRVVLLGHSEGALLAMMVARDFKLSGLIILNGQTERADILLKRQMQKNLPDSTFQIADKVLASLKQGKTIENISAPTLSGIFRSDIQPYLISWMMYDPALVIKNVSTPALIIQGLTDLQTGEEQANALANAQPSCKLVLIDEMNHVLKKTTKDNTENLRTYNNPDLRLHEMLLPTIISFVNSLN